MGPGVEGRDRPETGRFSAVSSKPPSLTVKSSMNEIDQLCCAAAWLELDLDFVTQHTDAYRTIEDTIALTPGLSVCFPRSATDNSEN